MGLGSGKQIDTWRLFDGQHGRYENSIDLSLKSPRSPVYIPRGELVNPEYKEDILTRWPRAAELYPARNLTYEVDKLPAISGLAAAVASLLKRRCLSCRNLGERSYTRPLVDTSIIQHWSNVVS